MKKMSVEVNDQEICRRFEILISTEKEDLPPPLVKKLLESPEDFDPKKMSDPVSQYARHYLYMVKRDMRNKKSEKISAPRPGPKASGQKKSGSGQGARTKKKVGGKTALTGGRG